VTTTTGCRASDVPARQRKRNESAPTCPSPPPAGSTSRTSPAARPATTLTPAPAPHQDALTAAAAAGQTSTHRPSHRARHPLISRGRPPAGPIVAASRAHKDQLRTLRIAKRPRLRTAQVRRIFRCPRSTDTAKRDCHGASAAEDANSWRARDFSRYADLMISRKREISLECVFKSPSDTFSKFFYELARLSHRQNIALRAGKPGLGCPHVQATSDRIRKTYPPLPRPVGTFLPFKVPYPYGA